MFDIPVLARYKFYFTSRLKLIGKWKHKKTTSFFSKFLTFSHLKPKIDKKENHNYIIIHKLKFLLKLWINIWENGILKNGLLHVNGNLDSVFISQGFCGDTVIINDSVPRDMKKKIERYFQFNCEQKLCVLGISR